MKVKLIRGGRYTNPVTFRGVDDLTAFLSDCGYKNIEMGDFLFIDFEDRMMVVNKKTEEILRFIDNDWWSVANYYDDYAEISELSSFDIKKLEIQSIEIIFN